MLLVCAAYKGCATVTSTAAAAHTPMTLYTQKHTCNTIAQPPGTTMSNTSTDCGAGVGRVTQELLLRFFNTVDLVEPSEHLLEQARANLTAAAGTAYPRDHSPGEFFQCGLQKYTPPAGRYVGMVGYHRAASIFLHGYPEYTDMM